LPFLKRRLLNALAVASLVLCVATLTLWIRSYFIADSLHARTERFGASIYVCRGSLCVGAWRWHGFHKSVPFYQRVAVDEFGSVYWQNYLESGNGGINLLGFWYFDFTRGKQIESLVVIPFWFLLLATASFPCLWVFRTRQRNWRDHHRCCPACGYDLRATPERCPECGAVPMKAGPS